MGTGPVSLPPTKWGKMERLARMDDSVEASQVLPAQSLNGVTERHMSVNSSTGPGSGVCSEPPDQFQPNLPGSVS